MKNYNSGFALITCIVYIAVSAILVSCIFNLASLSYSKYKSISTLNSSFANTVIGIDNLTKELKFASGLLQDWKRKDSNHFVFRKNQQLDIGWILKDSNLIRIEGIYDSNSDKWSSAIKSLALKNVKDISMEFESDFQNIKTVNLILDLKINNKITRFQSKIFLNNRVVISES